MGSSVAHPMVLCTVELVHSHVHSIAWLSLKNKIDDFTGPGNSVYTDLFQVHKQ